MNNTVELISYTGGDKFHIELLWNNIDNEPSPEKIRLDLIKAIDENPNIYNSSRLKFKFNTSYYIYHLLLISKKGNIYERPIRPGERETTGDYWIPRDLMNISLKKDIGNIGNSGENWYDVLNRYIQIGYQLQEHFHEVIPIQYSSNRNRAVSYLFNTLAHKKEYILDIGVKDFVDLFRDYNNIKIIFEMQDLLYNMVEQIKNLPEKPFNQTLNIFKLK